MPLLAGDAAAAARFLGGRRDIDPRRIALLGASQGGLVAAAAAAGPARDLPLRGVVLLMSPAVPGDQVVGDQVARQLQLASPQSGAYEDQRAFVDRLIAAVRTTPDPAALRRRLDEEIEAATRGGLISKDVAPSLVPGFTDPNMAAVLDYDPAPILKQLRLPVLSVFGERDIMVSAPRNAPVARRALSGVRDARVIELQGLNHMLQTASTGAPDEWSTLGPPFGSPVALDLVATWLRTRLAAPARQRTR